MAKTKIGLMVFLITIQGPLWLFFLYSLSWLPISARVSLPFHIYAKTNFSKKKA